MPHTTLPPELAAQVDLSHACYGLQATEVDAVSNIASRSPHTHVKVLPNHGLSRAGELEGFLFRAHHEDRASVIPFPSNIFEVICLYEVRPPTAASFNGDVLHILNNVDEYQTALDDFVADLTSRIHPRPAHFDCIPEPDDEQHALVPRTADQRTWSESVPTRIGLYHAFGVNALSGAREHKLYMLVHGHLRHACDDMHNLWHDCKEAISAAQFANCEELAWLRQATLRNHNRIASQLAKTFNLSVTHTLDLDDPSGECEMVRPTTATYLRDIRVCPRTQRVRLTSLACCSDTAVNGVLFDGADSGTYTLLHGPRDFAEGYQFGNAMRHTADNVLPTRTTEFHSAFAPGADAASSVWRLPNNEHAAVLWPDEKFFNTMQALGFNRNDGTRQLMPIVWCENAV